jgi:hypothetical protein
MDLQKVKDEVLALVVINGGAEGIITSKSCCICAWWI